MEVVVLFLISWLIPVRHWSSISRNLASARQLLRRDLAAREEHVESLLKDRPAGGRSGEIVGTNDVFVFLERLQLLRLYRPDGWNPNIRLEGGEHIEKALRAGNGAILWVAPFSFHSQVTKMAFGQAGYRVAHLSRYSHGFNATSRFGERCLNSIRTRQEERYLDERLVIGRDGSKDVLRRLEYLLRQNRLVSITVGRQARRACHVAFFNGTLKLATGPAFLSQKTGAPLLPVFTVRESDGQFITRIEPPLNDRSGAAADDDIEATVSTYGELLETYALQYPTQFLGGYSMMALCVRG